jgi:hypothetical protein
LIIPYSYCGGSSTWSTITSSDIRLLSTKHWLLMVRWSWWWILRCHSWWLLLTRRLVIILSSIISRRWSLLIGHSWPVMLLIWRVKILLRVPHGIACIWCRRSDSSPWIDSWKIWGILILSIHYRTSAWWSPAICIKSTPILWAVHPRITIVGHFRGSLIWLIWCPVDLFEWRNVIKLIYLSARCSTKWIWHRRLEISITMKVI